MMAKPSHCRPFLFMPSPILPFSIFFVVELSISSHIVVWLHQLLIGHDMKSSNCTHVCFIPFHSKSLMRSFARD